MNLGQLGSSWGVLTGCGIMDVELPHVQLLLLGEGEPPKVAKAIEGGWKSR